MTTSLSETVRAHGNAAPTRGRLAELRLSRHALVIAGLLLLPLALALVIVRIDDTVSGPGETDFAVLVNVSSRAPGRVEAVLVREGQIVEKGDLLIQLDRSGSLHNAALLEVEIDGLRGRLRLAQRRLETEDERRPAEIREKEQQLAALVAAEKQSEARFERSTRLRADILPEDQRAALELEHEEAVALRKAAEEKLTAFGLWLEGARNRSLDEIDELRAKLGLAETGLVHAQRLVAQTELCAPIRGIVLTPSPERLRGTLAEPGAPLLQLADPDSLRFVVSVDERQVSRVVAGQRCQVLLDAFPHHLYRGFEGVVLSAAEVESLDGQGMRSSYRVTIALADTGLDIADGARALRVGFRSGLTGEARIIVRESSDLLHFLRRRLETILPRGHTIR